MGYSYELADTGRYRLCCDSCGCSGGVVKRKCPHRVFYPGESPKGLPYCPAPALCAQCNRKHRGMHDKCKESARQRQAVINADHARLQAGDSKSVCRCGDWKEGVPAGCIETTFRDKDGLETILIHPAENSKDWLQDMPDLGTYSSLTRWKHLVNK